MTKKITYAILWLFIGVVSAIDVYWSIVLQDVLIETEMNPIGRLLLETSDGNVALFMLCKVMGLVAVLGILVVLYNYKKRIAWGCIVGVSIFQLWLLWYLNATGPLILSQSGSDRTQKEKRIEASQCPPMITPASPVDTDLKQNTGLRKVPSPAPNVENQTSNKSSTIHP